MFQETFKNMINSSCQVSGLFSLHGTESTEKATTFAAKWFYSQENPVYQMI